MSTIDIIGICVLSFIGVLVIVLFVWMGYTSLKNDRTFHVRAKIINAIHSYHEDMIKRGKYENISVNYCDLEEYDSTYKRFWDWGYKRILPPDKLEIIKPYIRKDDEHNA